MNLETMLYESDVDLIRLTLNRPHVLNAVNYPGYGGASPSGAGDP